MYIMLNFDSDIQSVIDTQKTSAKVRTFIEYSSKKSLFESGLLTEENQELISKLKGTFSFHIHTEGRYLVVVFYNAKEKKYSFLVVDLHTLTCAEADSIKNAKKGVLELVGDTSEEVTDEVATEVTEDTKEEAQEEAVEEVKEEAVEAEQQDTVEEVQEEATEETAEKKHSTRKSKKAAK